jgi:hypothetical protein
MSILNFVWLVVFLAVAVWIGPGLVGGLITTLALRREKPSLQLQDIISFAGRWMFSCFLGGLVTFVIMVPLSSLVPEGATGFSSLAVEYISFGVGGAVMGARGAKIIQSILDYS